MEKLILEAENLLALRGHPNAVAFKVQCMPGCMRGQIACGVQTACRFPLQTQALLDSFPFNYWYLSSDPSPTAMQAQNVCMTSDFSHVCILMEYVSGGDLHNHLERRVPNGVAPPRLVQHLLWQLISVIEYSHSIGTSG